MTDQIKLFVEQHSAELNVRYLVEDANYWLKENDGKITIIDKKFETSGNSMYLIFFFTINENK